MVLTIRRTSPWADGTSVAVEGTVLLSDDEGVVGGLEGSSDSVVDDGELLPWADGDSVGGHSLGSGLAGNPSVVVGLKGNEVGSVEGVDVEFLPWSDGTSVGHKSVSDWVVHGNPLVLPGSHDDSLVSNLDTPSGAL